MNIDYINEYFINYVLDTGYALILFFFDRHDMILNYDNIKI